MEPMQGEPVRPSSSRLDRVSSARAATWIIVVGLVLVAVALVSGLLNAFHDSYFGFGGGGTPSPTFLDRLQLFLSNSVGNVTWAVLVVAAGVAVRVAATRPQTETVLPPLPEPELPTSPVQLPDKVTTKVVLVEPSADDDIWRS